MRLLVISQTSLLALLVLSFLPSTLHLLSPSSMLEPYAKFSRTIPRHSTGLLARLFPLQEILFHQPLPPAAPIHPSDPSLGIIFSRNPLRFPSSWAGCSSYFSTMSLTPLQLLSLCIKMTCLFVCLSQEALSSMREDSSASLLHGNALCIT